jgi:hypothetical protein
MLVFNTEDNASLVTNSNMIRDPMANVTCTEELAESNTNGVVLGETPFIAGHQDAKVQESQILASHMQVASKIKEEEHSHTTLEII